MYKLYFPGKMASLKIAIYGFENSNTKDESDASWLSAHVNIKVPNFTAGYDAAFTIQDFEQLSNDLSKSLNNLKEQQEIEFWTPEKTLQFYLKFTRTGTVIVSGKSRTHNMPGGTLEFCFETDLYTTENFYKELNKMLNELRAEKP